MRAQRLVIAESDGDRLVTAVHRHEVDVDVDQQIAFGSATIDGQRLFVSRLADLDQTVGPFGVVVVITIGIVLVEDLRARPSASFPTRSSSGAGNWR
jgi:hypothetical protein